MNRWTKAEIELLKRVFPVEGTAAACEALNAAGYDRTQSAVSWKASVLGITTPTQFWSDAEEDIIRQFYPVGGRHLAHKMLMAEGYKRTIKAVAARAKRMGIKAPGNGRYQPGRAYKKWGPMKAETREKVKGTWFKAGHLPSNTKHDGCISVRKDTSGRGYKYIRLAKGKWVLYHRHLWKQHHGSIPKGMCIVFRDGDSLNCTIENLEMISRKENRNRNCKNGTAAERLTDPFVRHCIRNFHGIPDEEITPDLIEMFRLKYKTEREIKKLENQQS